MIHFLATVLIFLYTEYWDESIDEENIVAVQKNYAICYVQLRIFLFLATMFFYVCVCVCVRVRAFAMLNHINYIKL